MCSLGWYPLLLLWDRLHQLPAFCSFSPSLCSQVPQPDPTLPSGSPPFSPLTIATTFLQAPGSSFHTSHSPTPMPFSLQKERSSRPKMLFEHSSLFDSVDLKTLPSWAVPPVTFHCPRALKPSAPLMVPLRTHVLQTQMSPRESA